MSRRRVADLIDHDCVRSAAALRELTISPAILISQRLVHLYRVKSVGIATTTELISSRIAIISSGALIAAATTRIRRWAGRPPARAASAL